MNTGTIQEYHRWADRGYVTALTCKNHVYHKLMPLLTGEGLILVCPRGDYEKLLGVVEFKSIQSKIAMAEWLWRNKGLNV